MQIVVFPRTSGVAGVPMRIMSILQGEWRRWRSKANSSLPQDEWRRWGDNANNEHPPGRVAPLEVRCK